MGQLSAGFPVEVPTSTVNRQCSSGLQAVASVADGIRAGRYDMGLAGGVESMTNFNIMEMIDPTKYAEAGKEHAVAGNCLVPMGITAENVSEKYGVPRSRMDAFAARSHQRAAAAQQAGRFAEETVAVAGCEADDGVRAQTTAESL